MIIRKQNQLSHSQPTEILLTIVSSLQQTIKEVVKESEGFYKELTDADKGRKTGIQFFGQELLNFTSTDWQ